MRETRANKLRAVGPLALTTTTMLQPVLFYYKLVTKLFKARFIKCQQIVS